MSFPYRQRQSMVEKSSSVNTARVVVHYFEKGLIPEFDNVWVKRRCNFSD